MSIAWVAYVLATGALAAGAARGAEGACRLTHRPGRWCWAAALALTAALAGLAPLRPAARSAATPLLAPPAATSVARDVERGMPGVLVRIRAVRMAGQRAVRRAIAGASRSVPAAIARALGVLWMLGSLTLGVGLVVVLRRLHGLRGAWPATHIGGTRVRVAPDAGPAVCGLLRPDIVVPRWLLELDPGAQRLVLAHEREHLRARDPLLLVAAWVVAIALPWHPAVWWMLARLRLAVELDCDARVLRGGASPRAYGTLLIDLAGRRRGRFAGALALADRPSHLERRIHAMRPTLPRFATPRATMFGALALLATLAACETTLPTTAEVTRMDAAAAERGTRAMALGVGDSTPAVYLVDGVRVRAEVARALRPEEIATIDVRRAGAGSAGRVIRITRRAAVGARDSARASGGTVAQGGADQAPARAVRLRVLTPDGSGAARFTGVILVDGARVDAAALQRLEPAEIVSVEVIKGPAAARLDPAPEAANGIIRITTRRGRTAP